MEIVELTRALKARRYLTALVLVLAVGAGVAMKVQSHSVPTGTATSQLLIDSPQSALADLQQDTGPLAARAAVYAQLMTSGAVLRSIAQAAGLPASEVTAEGPYSGAGQVLDVPTPSEARGPQILATKVKYHMSFVAQQTLPVITVSVTGPTAETAGKLANSVVTGVRSWLATLENSNSLPTGKRVIVRQLGDAQAGTVNSSSGTILAAVAAAAVLILGLLGLVLAEGHRMRRRDGGAEPVSASGPVPAVQDNVAQALAPLADVDGEAAGIGMPEEEDSLTDALGGRVPERAKAPEPDSPTASYADPEDTVDQDFEYWLTQGQSGFSTSLRSALARAHAEKSGFADREANRSAQAR